ncbi:MAG: hypothetical protein JNM90_11125 [Burkholderiales bacterium]|nr:hypothetical protein [Burkholderiales bacterium]
MAPGLRTRTRLFAGCIAAGAAAGALGAHLTGSDAWWLCVPAAVAAGWLAVADPTRCAAAPPRPSDRADGLE